MPEQIGIFDVIENCRAMRRLKPDPLAEELLLKVIDAGNRAPTGSNAQNVRWIGVRDPAQKQKLADLNRAAVTAYMEGGRRIPELPHQTEAQRERQRQAVLWQMEHMHEIPALIIACLEFEAPPGNAYGMGGGSVWPAVQNVLLATRALGLGAAPTTLGLSNRAAAKAVLGLPATVEPYCLIPVGYPHGKFGPVRRLPVAQTLHWDRWE